MNICIKLYIDTNIVFSSGLLQKRVFFKHLTAVVYCTENSLFLSADLLDKSTKIVLLRPGESENISKKIRNC